MSGGDLPWWARGLRFTCTGCGACCRGEGVVWVDRREIRAIARFLGVSLETFARRYLRRLGRRLSLVEKDNHDCVFWDEEQGCSIYPRRPRQCRTYPFWSRCLESPESWREEAAECEGIGGGRLYSRAEIVALRTGRGATRQPEEG
jgi:Fe-S-cluster containining protein